MNRTSSDISHRQTLDFVIDSLAWCRSHLDERMASEKVRQLDVTLGALALALDHEMDGEPAQAREALAHIDWSRRASEKPLYDCW